MRSRFYWWSVAALILFTSGRLSAQVARPGDSEPRCIVPLAEFLATVDRANPDVAAQRSAVDIADAQRQVARLFPNPTLSLGYSRDISGQQQAGTTSPNLSQTVLLGGKIAARAAVADRTYEQTSAQFNDFSRTLHGTAASAYVDAMVAELAADRRRRSAEAVDRLAVADEARYRSGDIGEIDMLQSRVERLHFRADFLAAESAHRAALLALSLLMGKRNNDTIFVPEAYHEAPAPSFDLHALLDTAAARRPDLVAARRATDAARAGMRLARANRVSDLDLGVGLVHNTQGRNPIDPTPIWQAFGLSIGLTIPLSNLVNRGDLAVAQYTAEQARWAQVSVELHVENDVRQAYARYEIAVERLGTYSGSLLKDAEHVLAGRTYSYQRGSASLTDVLIAQQALNDLYLSYYDAVGEYLKALIGLRQAAGIAVQGL